MTFLSSVDFDGLVWVSPWIRTLHVEARAFPAPARRSIVATNHQGEIE